MFVCDLETYSNRIPFDLPDVKTVGWLSAEHEYSMGEVSTELQEKLWMCVKQRTERFDLHVNVVRGVHPCNLCGEEIRCSDRTTVLGMSEVWIPTENKWFAAPSLVAHYIAHHAYQPPQEFLYALKDLDMESRQNAQRAFEDIVRPIMSSRQ